MEHTVTTLNRPDQDFDIKLRPSRFADFTGQDKIKERLELFVQAAKARVPFGSVRLIRYFDYRGSDVWMSFFQ